MQILIFARHSLDRLRCRYPLAYYEPLRAVNPESILAV